MLELLLRHQNLEPPELPPATSDPPSLMTDEPLPKALGPADMQRAFNISESTFFRMQREGEFKPFLLPRPIAGKKYSGERVQTFLTGRKA